MRLIPVVGLKGNLISIYQEWIRDRINAGRTICSYIAWYDITYGPMCHHDLTLARELSRSADKVVES